jgi:phenylacetate-coenzyme A ligase PaaK-like adenylate-forming protein
MSATQSIARFMSTPLEELLSRDHLLHARERLLDLFRRTVREVPAYREFLATQQFDPASVRTNEDFARLPLLTRIR